MKRINIIKRMMCDKVIDLQTPMKVNKYFRDYSIHQRREDSGEAFTWVKPVPPRGRA